MRCIELDSFFVIISISPFYIRYSTKEEFSFLRYTLKLTHFVRLFTNIVHISTSRTSFKLFLHIFVVSIFDNSLFAYICNLSVYSIGYNCKVRIIPLLSYSHSIFIGYIPFFTLFKYFLESFSLSFWYRYLWIFAHKLFHYIYTNKLLNICTSNRKFANIISYRINSSFF
nr:MAG TPA: hypothetical protein [Caudoviricetes sp.]